MKPRFLAVGILSSPPLELPRLEPIRISFSKLAYSHLEPRNLHPEVGLVDDLRTPAYYKNMPYRSERELRVIAAPSIGESESLPEGIRLRSLNVAHLIDEVITHPHARRGFTEVIQRLVRLRLPKTRCRISVIGRLY